MHSHLSKEQRDEIRDLVFSADVRDQLLDKLRDAVDVRQHHLDRLREENDRHIEAPDTDAFPCLRLAREAALAGGTAAPLTGDRTCVEIATGAMVPAGTDADYFILSFARELDAVVVELDSATAAQRSLPAGMSEEPMLDEPWKLVVPSEALIDTENVDLARLPLPWIGVEHSAANASVIGRLHRSTGGQAKTVHQYQETLTALALVAAGEGVAVVPALALSGVVQDGVDVLDVPGLGTRRIVLRRFDRRKSVNGPVDTVARLLRESVAAFDAHAVVQRP